MIYFSTLFVFLMVFMSCSSDKNVTIPDASLAAVVHDALDLAPSDPIPEKRLKELEELSTYQYNIEDLTGLEKATGLKVLRLYDNKISELGPIANLTQLTTLLLPGNPISDIRPIANLTQTNQFRP